MGTQSYPDDMSLLEARALFFERSKLGEDGGYSSRWVRVEAPVPFYFPNWQGRVDAARLHDLHHIAAEYASDWPGEVEIAAWEIASNCRRYSAAWLLDLAGWNAGLVIAPRRMFRAFVRGRRARKNLYKEPLHESQLARITVGELRDQLGLRGEPAKANLSDVLVFGFWSAAVVLVLDVLPAIAVLGLWRRLRRSDG
ncbi:MAG TPA: hypothetical protein VG095_02670 [Chthoniobacterales bacterium]|nr:hypothetical protein [Chthoniobacterales bacterium]